MRVLVTGGTGFIGGYVVRELQERGHNPVIFDHYDRREADCPTILGDIRDGVAVVEAFAQVDSFIHLAAVLGTQETIQNPAPAAKTNILGGLNILDAAAQYGIAGTYIGVGNHWMNNTYSISKTTVERFVRMYNTERGTSINVVRAMNAYGPKQRAPKPFGSARVRKIAPSMICRALSGMPVEVYGDGSQVSDMVYVGDVAKALVSATEKASGGVVFDDAVEVGPDTHTTVAEFAHMVVEECGSASGVEYLPMRPGEIPGATVSANVSSLSLVDMNASDLVCLDVGLRNTVEYFRGLLGE